MKKIDPNNFVIDHVFAQIDKIYKKIKKKEKKKSKKLDKVSVLDSVNIDKVHDPKVSIDTVETTTNESPNNGYYTITINV